MGTVLGLGVGVCQMLVAHPRQLPDPGGYVRAARGLPANCPHQSRQRPTTANNATRQNRSSGHVFPRQPTATNHAGQVPLQRLKQPCFRRPRPAPSAWGTDGAPLGHGHYRLALSEQHRGVMVRQVVGSRRAWDSGAINSGREDACAVVGVRIRRAEPGREQRAVMEPGGPRRSDLSGSPSARGGSSRNDPQADERTCLPRSERTCHGRRGDVPAGHRHRVGRFAPTRPALPSGAPGRPKTGKRAVMPMTRA
jgi:hypothetical protein